MAAEMLLIGELARRSAVSVDTVRYYERRGLLPGVQRDPSGYRRFPPAAARRIRVIRAAMKMGFTLDELTRVFRQREAGSPPCREVHRLAGAKLLEIERQIVELTALHTTLKDTLSSWSSALQTSGEGAFAHLLDALVKPSEES